MGKFFRELKDLILSPWTYRLIRVGLAVVFLYAGTNKLLETRSFATIIEAYGLVPIAWIRPISLFLPLLEVLAAFGLIFEVRGSLTVIAGLLLFFMAVLAYGIWMEFDVNCGCWGFDSPEVRKKAGLVAALYRDLVMMAAVIYLYVWRSAKSAAPDGGPILLRWQ